MNHHEPFNPYAASAAEAPTDLPAGVLPTGPYGPYRDNRTLAKWVIGLLVLGVILQSVRAVLDLKYTLFPDTGDAGSLERLEQGLLVASWTAYVCFFVFGAWIVRSGKNAWLFAGVRGVAANQPSDTPGWAVGWYFIPIANLWKPYVAMREIVAASTVRDGLSSTLLPVWWTFWILASFADSFTNAASKYADSWNAVVIAVAWTTASAINIASHLVAIGLVRAVTALQCDTALALASSAVSDSDPPAAA